MNTSIGFKGSLHSHPRFGLVRKATENELQRLQAKANDLFGDRGGYVGRNLNAENTLVVVDENLPPEQKKSAESRDLKTIAKEAFQILVRGKDLFLLNVFQDSAMANAHLSNGAAKYRANPMVRFNQHESVGDAEVLAWFERKW